MRYVALLVFMTFAPSALAEEIKLHGHTFTLPPGFSIERAAGPPLVERPITADFDEQGRLYVAESSGSNDKVDQQLRDLPHCILQLTDTDGDGVFDRRTVFADKLMLPQGTLWYDGSLYVSAAPSIWKLTDTNNDGVADRREEWFQGKTVTGCANDLHGPYLGPDGWIYWCKGAFAEQTYERKGKPPLVTRAAHLFRARPDGTGLEVVMTGGMDNPVDIAFTATGERIFTTTFLVHPGGGQRDGLIHAIYGGVYGKEHGVLDGHPRTGDLMPVLSHLGAAAPAGLTTYDSQVFGKEYAGNMFAAQFNLHKVSRHVLSPQGAGLASQDQDFLVSDQIDFHPTDVLEDADGSLLVVDTGGWYKLCCPTSQLAKPDVLGAIYRVRRKDAARIEDPRGAKLQLGQLTDQELIRLLADPRPALRRQVMQNLAARPDAAVTALKEAYPSAEPLVRQRILWVLARIPSRPAYEATLLGLDDADEQVRQVALQVASLRPDVRGYVKVTKLLDSKYPAYQRRLAMEVLGRIGDRSAVDLLLASAPTVDAQDRALEHALIYALIEIDSAAETRAGLRHADASVQRAALIALSEMRNGKLTAEEVIPLLTAQDPALRTAAAWIVSRQSGWGQALAGHLEARLNNLAAGDVAQLKPLLQQFAAATPVAELLASTARNPQAPPAQRELALTVMANATMKTPPTVWADALAGVLAQQDAKLWSLALVASKQLTWGVSLPGGLGPELNKLAHNERVDVPLRIAALAALARERGPLDEAAFQLLLSALKSETAAAQHPAIVETLTQAKLTAAQRRELTTAFAKIGALEINPLLAAYEAADDEATGQALVAALQTSPAAASLRSDALQRALAKFPASVRDAAQPLLARLQIDTAQQRAALQQLLASLPAGDVRRGLAVFHSRKAACTSCHALGYVGGNIGPDLTHIGRVRSQADLLESIVYPSQSFVRSYEPVVVSLHSGVVHSGTIRSQTSSELVLATGPDKLVRIGLDEIEEQTPGRVSVMPAGLDKQLTAQELADLITFLQSAK